MVNSCYLCSRKASKANNISLHRFPKNVDIRTKWLNACGLTANDNVSRTCLCSRHFRTEYKCQSNIFGSVKHSIKRNAVPTLFLTNPLNIGKSNESPSKTPLMELFNENGVANQSSSFFSIITDINYIDSNTVTERIEIKEEPSIHIKEEPMVAIKEEPYFLNYETNSTTQIIQSPDPLSNSVAQSNGEHQDLNSECIQFGNYVIGELQKLSDHNSLTVAKQCIQSVILSAQNGLYKNGVVPSILTGPTTSAVKTEPNN